MIASMNEIVVRWLDEAVAQRFYSIAVCM